MNNRFIVYSDCYFHEAFDSDFICIRCQDEENCIEQEYLGYLVEL